MSNILTRTTSGQLAIKFRPVTAEEHLAQAIVLDDRPLLDPGDPRQDRFLARRGQP